MPKLFKKISPILKYFCLVALFFLLFADNSFSAISNINDSKNNNFGLDLTASDVGLKIKDNAPTIAIIVGNIIGVALSLLGVVFMILIIYGGYMWMMSRGNDAEADKAKDIIVNATIGVIIIFSAYVLTNYILTSLSGTIS
jgi:hypothetical protein